MFLVYLAGSIKGTSYRSSTSWRDYVTEKLREWGINCLSPMRGKGYLASEKSIGDSYEEHSLSTAKGITHRDKFDVTRCDLMFVYLVGAQGVSIGTMIEIGWASMLDKPILLVREEGNIHNHGMVNTLCGWIVESLDEAVDLARFILLPDGSEKISE